MTVRFDKARRVNTRLGGGQRMGYVSDTGEPGSKTHRFNTWAKQHPVLVALTIAFFIAVGLLFRFLRYTT